jgi:FPC/CPF motif-containing protein YcgG
VLQRGAVRVGVHEGFGGFAAAVTCHDLYECLAEVPPESDSFVSHAALFPDAHVDDEAAFEQAMWSHLQAMHEVDRRHFDWDPSVSADARDARFSFSIGGRAWYVVGMHPKASRLARRFPVPMLVFNPHAQFEQLRESGRYGALRDRIRERDVALQGSVNPMLVDHGRDSEARQYSGREVSRDWRCPFRHRAPE